MIIARLDESLEAKSRTDNPFFEYASKSVIEPEIGFDENDFGNSVRLCPKIFRRFKLLLFAGCTGIWSWCKGSSMNHFYWAIVDMLTGVEAEDEEVPLNRSTGKSVLESFDCWDAIAEIELPTTPLSPVLVPIRSKIKSWLVRLLDLLVDAE